MFLSVCFDN